MAEFFSAYVTTRTYSWLDKYDARGENRRIARLAEKENKKFRDAAKKERNDLVRSLLKFVRKRDKRVEAFNQELALKKAENSRKTEEMRQRHLQERKKLLEETDFVGMNEMEDELQRLEDELDANEEDELFCVACNKELRNEKAFAAHRKQKKHLENLQALKESMIQEDLLNSDDLKDTDDDSEPENHVELPPAEPEIVQESEEQVQQTTVTKKDKKVKKTKKKGAKNQDKMAAAATAAPVHDLQCAVCKEEFTSKNKLFSHLKTTGHAVALKS